MKRVYVTGGSGVIGSALVARLAADQRVELVVSGDLHEPPADRMVANVVYEYADVTEPETLPEQFVRHRIDSVVHLAAIITPGKRTTVEQEYAVDVEGSRAVFAACIETGVRRVIVASSGAVYGYHPDNPEWLTESDALRGNDRFPYSKHRRMVEESLADLRGAHPELEQIIFRIGTVLGPTVNSQVTALWDGKRVLEIRGSESPFVFIWIDDVVGAMLRAVTGDQVGIFNVAGDGKLTVRELAAIMRKGRIKVPAWALTAALWVGHALRLTMHDPEQVRFLRYRPVLSNRALKEDFGYVPAMTTRQAFDAYLRARSAR